jgi:hypothetical protein
MGGKIPPTPVGCAAVVIVFELGLGSTPFNDKNIHLNSLVWVWV